MTTFFGIAIFSSGNRVFFRTFLYFESIHKIFVHHSKTIYISGIRQRNSTSSDNQFGFKSCHSTDLCIYALKEFIEYYKNRGTTVYVTFLDASKAFDKLLVVV